MVSCSFQRKHWVYCQYQAIELIYITLSNHCHAARNNFAVVMHVRTNPYLSCIEKKMSKTKTCNYTETYTALRERAFWGEPGSICQVTSRLFYFFFSKLLWRLFHTKLLQGSYLGSGLIYTTVQRFEVGKNAFKRCLIVSLRMHLFDQNKVKKQWNFRIETKTFYILTCDVKMNE